MKVSQSCPTLCDPDGLCSPWNSPGQNTGSGSSFPSPGDLPNQEIKLRSPARWADSLPAEPEGRPKHWSGKTTPSPVDLPSPGIKPGSPASHADSLPMSYQGSPTWKESYDKPRQHIIKQIHHFANKGPYSQSYGFSSSHVLM